MTRSREDYLTGNDFTFKAIGLTPVRPVFIPCNIEKFTFVAINLFSHLPYK
ncbi:hypothetical protein LF845_00380 [Deferribacterales bacterium Es71-Z0220]|uniref:hypothetical protein n=1 Tax=Deferrivibrio essentukiensis TaxID=2880922 RepID=UPI001F616B9E|nr:hypothetical protein [Deferrivibrio essentukiensis]MCB4203410.1 hypothetical protein [Deferrivibrio essentukiensis]